MNHNDFEQLYVRSLDETLTTIESHQLLSALHDDPECAKIAAGHDLIRKIAKRKEQSSFGPDFASTVMRAIQKGISTFDEEMAFIFKKVHLLAAGVVICLLVINIFYADEFSVQSVLGLDSTSTPSPAPAEDDIVFDFSEIMNNSNE